MFMKKTATSSTLVLGLNFREPGPGLSVVLLQC